MKNGKRSKRMKKNENASFDQLTSANSQMQFFGLVGQTVNDSDRMLDENNDRVEDTLVVLDEKTRNKNIFTVRTNLPANVAANLVIGEVIVPEFIETATLSEDSNHFLSFEDSEMNDSSVGSCVQSGLELLETKDETENSKKRSSFVSLHANPLFCGGVINESSEEI